MPYLCKGSDLSELLIRRDVLNSSIYFINFGSYFLYYNEASTPNWTGNFYKQNNIGFSQNGVDIGPTFTASHANKVGTNGIDGRNELISITTTTAGTTRDSVLENITVPTGASIIRGFLIGGGGGGGSGQAGNGQHSGGSGGSSGYYAFKINKADLVNFSSLHVSVGGGGNGGNGLANDSNAACFGASGGAGGTTTLYYKTTSNTDISLVQVGGGGGGGGGTNDWGTGGINGKVESYKTYILSDGYDLGLVGRTATSSNVSAAGFKCTFPSDTNRNFPYGYGVNYGASGFGGTSPSNRQGNPGGGGNGGGARIYFLT